MKPHRTVHKKQHTKGQGHGHEQHDKATSSHAPKAEGRKSRYKVLAPIESTETNTTNDVPSSSAASIATTTTAVASTTEAEVSEAPSPTLADTTPTPKSAKAPNKRCYCCRGGGGARGCCKCRCCSKCFKCMCQYFPLCWNIPLVTTLQLLSVLDLFVCIGSICLWLYFHQFGPFSERLQTGNFSSSVSQLSDFGQRATTESTTESYLQIGQLPSRKGTYIYEMQYFHESSTELGTDLFNGRKVVDVHAESVRYSKLAYLNSKYQQDVEEGCGYDYYMRNLFGHQLNITRDLFYEILYTNYFSEGVSMFIDVAMIATSVAFFSKKEAKCFLMFLWMVELAIIWSKIWTTVAIRSQRLCIIEFGLGPDVWGVQYLTFFFMAPVTLFRFYKWLVYSYFVYSFFTPAGVLRGEDNTQERSLREYIRKQEELLGMDHEKELSSSEEDNIEHL